MVHSIIGRTLSIMLVIVLLHCIDVRGQEQTPPTINTRAILALPDIRPGDKDDGLVQVQNYLKRFGYLKEKVEVTPGEMDDATVDALVRFQLYKGIDPDMLGVLDETTRLAMNRPRCGNPTLLPALKAEPHVWKKRNLTYSFGPVTNQVPTGLAQRAVAAAFRTWENAGVGLKFERVTQDADIAVEWRPANDPDRDMRGKPIAHATWGHPPPQALHFDDEEESWTIGGVYDIETTALHEIGHNLGLEHSPYEQAVMYEDYNHLRLELRGHDIGEIHRLYPISNPLSGIRRIRNLHRKHELGGQFIRQEEEDTRPHLSLSAGSAAGWNVIRNKKTYWLQNRKTDEYLTVQIDGSGNSYVNALPQKLHARWAITKTNRGYLLQYDGTNAYKDWYLDMDGNTGALVVSKKIYRGCYWQFCLPP